MVIMLIRCIFLVNKPSIIVCALWMKVFTSCVQVFSLSFSKILSLSVFHTIKYLCILVFRLENQICISSFFTTISRPSQLIPPRKIKMWTKPKDYFKLIVDAFFWISICEPMLRKELSTYYNNNKFKKKYTTCDHN